MTLARQDRKRRGELQRFWLDVEQLLGVGRDTVLRRAWAEIREQNPGASAAVLETLMRRPGVAFEFGGYRVEIRQPSRRFRCWLKPLAAGVTA